MIHSPASQSATPTTRLSARGSTPAAPATTTIPAAAKPPTLQPPWSDDMIGLRSSRSTATPWRVHRDVHHAVGGPEGEQDRPEHRRARGQERQRQHQAEHERRRPRDRAARAAVEHVARQRHRDQRAGGHAQQAEPDRRLRHVEPVLEPRDVGDPGADHGAVDRERAERRDARRHAGPAVARPSAAALSRRRSRARACPGRRGRRSPWP